MMQLITAIGALLGTFVSLLTEGMGKKYIIAWLERYLLIFHLTLCNFIIYFR